MYSCGRLYEEFTMSAGSQPIRAKYSVNFTFSMSAGAEAAIGGEAKSVRSGTEGVK